MKKSSLRSLIPHLVALGIFVIIGCIYFLPALQGYRLQQGDMKNTAGMVKEANDYKAKTGEQALWSNSMFGGMPTFQTSFDNGGDYFKYFHLAVVRALPSPIGIWLLYAIGFYVLMMALNVRHWVAIAGSLAYAFSSYFIIIMEVGHVTKAFAIGYMPVVLAGFIWAYRGRYLTGAVVTALGFALELYSNHVQVTYYLGIALLFFGIGQLVEAIRTKTLPVFFKATGVVLGALVIGLLCNFGPLYNTYIYGEHTTRGKTELTIQADGKSNQENVTSGLDRTYVTQWSYGLQESWTLLIPNAKGGATGAIGDHKALAKVDPQFRESLAQQNHYWGDQNLGTAGPVYVGAGVFLLFVLGMVLLRGALKWSLFAAALLCLMLSWGKNFMDLTNFFLDYVPGYNKFRAVTIILVIVELCIPVIAFLFVNYLIENRETLELRKKQLIYAGSSVLALLLAFYLLPDSFLDFISASEKQGIEDQAAKQPEMATTLQLFVENLKDVRISIFKSDVIRSFFFAGATFALVFLFLRKTVSQTVLIAGIGLLTLLDLYAVDRRYLGSEKDRGAYRHWEEARENQFPYMPTQFDQQIMQRELSTRPELARKIDEAVEKRRAQKRESGDPAVLSEAEIAAVQFSELNAATNYRVFNLGVSPFQDASTSYFHKSVGGYHGAKLKRFHELIEFHFSQGINTEVLNMLNTKYVITGQGLQVNPEAAGNAWFVKGVKLVANANEEILALKNFKAADTAVVDQRFRNEVRPFTPDSAAAIHLVSYSPDHLVYSSNAGSDQLAVFSEIYYPDGWQSYIDGRAVPHFRADYLLRAMMVPAGTHKIEFRFEPASVPLGRTVSATGSVLLFLLIGAAGFVAYRKRVAEQR